MKKYLYYIFNYIFIITFLAIFLGTLFFNKSLIYQEKVYVSIISFLVMLVILAIIYFCLNNKMKEISLKREIIISGIIGFIILVLQVLCIYYLKSSPAWDWKDIYSSALAYVKGDFNSIDYSYFEKFANNYGMLYFEILLFKVLNFFGLIEHSLGAMVGVNLILVDISVIFLYLTIRNLYDNKKAIFSLVLVLLTVPFFNYLPILYTDTASMMFPIAMLYVYSIFIKDRKNENKNDVKSIILFAILGMITVISIKIKFTCIIMLIAIGIDIIMRYKFKEYFKQILVMLIVILLFNGLYTVFEYRLPVFNFDVSNNDKLIPYTHWIMMGLGRRESGIDGRDFIGSYSKDAYDLTLSYDNVSDRKAANIEEIKNIIFKKYGIKNYLLFLYDKALFVWSDGTYYAPAFLRENPFVTKENIFSSLFHSDGKNVRYMFNENISMSLVMYFMFLVSSLGHVITKKNIISVTHIAIFGMFVFFLIWESSSRYLVNYVPIFLVCTINGFDLFNNLINKVCSKYKLKSRLK